ncbi:LysE family transporter [Oceanobacter mangrovi]|uniref:LysE family transporter n=1 Tax=Oceanobacter mangrovi TaxID=2862510 RepID=UPI001C8D9A84|nr:LysE family transporter [Oceanobacter mangrovi]
MSFEMWLAFFTACWVISISPGAGAVASMASGLKYGFPYGYWNVIGLQSALALQILIVAAGVGAVLVASELAFQLIKWFGVGYLVFLAWQQWRAVPTDMEAQTHQLEQQLQRESPQKMILKGFLVNISNPKAIVFMLAVLPQFVDVTKSQLPQYSLMMVTMIAVDMIVMAGYTGLAAKVLRYLKSPRQQKILNRSFAAMFVGAASLLSLVNRSN